MTRSVWPGTLRLQMRTVTSGYKPQTTGPGPEDRTHGDIRGAGGGSEGGATGLPVRRNQQIRRQTHFIVRVPTPVH